MLSREGKQTDRGAVGAEFIGYNRRRREALLLQEFPHQPNCRPSVPAGLNQEIQDFALTVHGTPEIELPPSNYDDHLVQVPAFGRSWPPTLNPPRIGPTEFQDPSSNCLIRDVETTLGKQVLNVPIAQRETAIEPDGMLDDDRWKAVTTVGYLAHPETLKHRPCRSHAVNVTMPLRRIHADDRSVSLHLGPSGLPVKSSLFPLGTLMPSAREGPPQPSRRPTSGVGGVHSICSGPRKHARRGPERTNGPCCLASRARSAACCGRLCDGSGSSTPSPSAPPRSPPSDKRCPPIRPRPCCPHPGYRREPYCRASPRRSPDSAAPACTDGPR